MDPFVPLTHKDDENLSSDDCLIGKLVSDATSGTLLVNFSFAAASSRGGELLGRDGLFQRPVGTVTMAQA